MQVRDSGVVAGTVLYKTLPDDNRMEVGWHVCPDSWGQGFALAPALVRVF